MTNPPNKKEQNLLKGAVRRIFSRSELRKQVLASVHMAGYMSLNRPRVKKWSMCPGCNLPVPEYLMEVDHVVPIIPLDKSLSDLTWDEVVDRAWCDVSNLRPLCKEKCHKEKTKIENLHRREFRKGNKK